MLLNVVYGVSYYPGVGVGIVDIARLQVTAIGVGDREGIEGCHILPGAMKDYFQFVDALDFYGCIFW